MGAKKGQDLNTGAIVPVTPQQNGQRCIIQAPRDWMEEVQPGSVLTTLDVSDEKGRALLYNATQVTLPLWDHCGKVLRAVNVVVESVEMENLETGEMSPGIRTTLVCADGTCYGTTSWYAYKSIVRAFNMVRQAPWNPPLLLKAIRARSRNNRDFLALYVVTED